MLCGQVAEASICKAVLGMQSKAETRREGKPLLLVIQGPIIFSHFADEQPGIGAWSYRSRKKMQVPVSYHLQNLASKEIIREHREKKEWSLENEQKFPDGEDKVIAIWGFVYIGHSQQEPHSPVPLQEESIARASNPTVEKGNKTKIVEFGTQSFLVLSPWKQGGISFIPEMKLKSITVAADWINWGEGGRDQNQKHSDGQIYLKHSTRETQGVNHSKERKRGVRVILGRKKLVQLDAEITFSKGRKSQGM